MYEINSPLRRGGSISKADPEFIARATHLMGQSAQLAVDALGDLAALDSLVQGSFMKQLNNAAGALTGKTDITDSNKKIEAAFAKSEITANAFLGRAFGQMRGICDYIEDCNYLLGNRCKSVIREAIHSSPKTISGVAGTLGVSQGYLEIALLRCAYGT
ncbi:hypothetical protein GF343_05750 [Candidatus Woesearchaeota archaeon]|nr:hypothetical protein [Candidatus Woesearchaeota archaeon]